MLNQDETNWRAVEGYLAALNFFLRRQQKTLAPIFLSLSLLTATGCGGSRSSKGGATLTLGAYTTPREAYSKAIIPEFQKYWKAQTGQDVEFQESYQASGAQSRAITSGFEADI
ncbi:MAG TPA: hypothetical protein VKE91_01570, partial [Blastocatellia bacterium]|nr:hypothetical protein [Blastocatellia bacterium]